MMLILAEEDEGDLSADANSDLLTMTRAERSAAGRAAALRMWDAAALMGVRDDDDDAE